MRERLALLLCGLTLVLGVGLAWLFAVRHNPRPTAGGAAASSSAPAVAPPADGAGGRLFRDLGCAGCHAVGGAGNPRHPLDGVSLRLSRSELEAWITGTGVAAERLSGAVVRRKERYRELPAADLDALVDYLRAADAVRP